MKRSTRGWLVSESVVDLVAVPLAQKMSLAFFVATLLDPRQQIFLIDI